MDWFDIYRREFYDLVERFGNEEIDYDEFIDKIENASQFAVESIGEETYNYWLNIKSDYIALKKFNRNKNQIALF